MTLGHVWRIVVEISGGMCAGTPNSSRGITSYSSSRSVSQPGLSYTFVHRTSVAMSDCEAHPNGEGRHPPQRARCSPAAGQPGLTACNAIKVRNPSRTHHRVLQMTEPRRSVETRRALVQLSLLQHHGAQRREAARSTNTTGGNCLRGSSVINVIILAPSLPTSAILTCCRPSP